MDYSIKCGAIVDYGCVIEEGAYVCLGVIVKVEKRILNCMRIGEWAIIPNRTYPV